jgi:hypothetical protein
MKLFDLFRSESRFKIGQQPARLYFRDDRPSALQGWFFSDRAVSRLWDALIATNLQWIWESTRTGPPVRITDDETNPEHRMRQLVTEHNIEELRYDLQEINLHGFKRFVALYGGGPELIKLTGDDELRAEVEAFAEGRKSVMATLIVQLGDVAADVIYFNTQSGAFLDVLLNTFNVPPISEIKRSKYREMNGEDLDTVVKYLSCAEHEH